MSKEDLPSIEDFIDENLPSVEDFIEEGKDNLPSLDSLVENNILPSIEDIQDNKDLPSVEDFTEILTEETVSIEDAEGNTFAEIEDIIPPWPELLKIINDVRDQIPDIPEIKYYDAELEKLCEIVDEIRSEIPEVKYYDAEVEAICEQIDSVRDVVSNLPEPKYYDETIDSIENRINVIKEDIANLPEPKYYDEDLQSIKEEIEVVKKEFPWIEANFKGIVEDFEKVRDSIGTVEEKVNLELDSILETIDVKAFENKVLTNEVKDNFENDKKKICEEIKESSQKIFDLHKEFKDDDRKLKKQIKGEYDKLKQSVQEQLEKYNQESVKTDELLLKYFTDLKEEIGKLPEVKYYDNEIKSLKTSISKSSDRFSPIESDIKSIYKIVEDIKKTQIELNEQIINEPSEVNQDIGAGKDPLTPIDQKFATLDDLSKHYQLFVTRIQQQLSTIGGGGAGYIKDLSDVVFDTGIGTNKLLIYDGTKWVGIASTALGGSGGGSQDLNSVLTNGNTSSLGIGVGFVTATFLDVSGITTLGSSNGIGTVTIGVGSTALFVDGNARITGILSVGQGTITIDGDANTVTATTFNGSLNGNVTGTAAGLSGTPDITVRNVSVTGVTTLSGATKLESSNYLQLKDNTNIIGHNGVNNLFRFTDSLQFRGDTLFFQEYDGTEYVRMSEQFGVQLKHQGSTKLQIESDGITVTGTINDHTIPSGSGTFALTSDIPTNNNELTNGAGYITTSFTNTNQLTNGAGFITASDDITGTAAGLSGNPNISVGSITATSAEFSGNVTIGGTLTYEDVTNVDSIGLITARSGINVSGGEILVGSGFSVGQTGVVTATTFSGSGSLLTSIPNGALDNSSVSYGGVSLNLGETDATPAFDLSDATNYPFASLTGITTNIVGDTSPQLGGNLDLNSNNITGTGDIDFTGNLVVDTNTLYVDSVNNRIGIGTTNPAYQVEIENTGANALLVLDRTDGAACFIEGQETRSAFGSVNETPLALAYNSFAVVLIGENGVITVNPDGDGFTLPNTDGSAGQVLQTDGNGTVSFATVSSGGISNVVDDTTPQLGGNLDLNSKDITGTGDVNITGISTFNTGIGTVHIGIGSTTLLVDGDARVLGILTVGRSSITLDGDNNRLLIGDEEVVISNSSITIGDNVTINSSATGINSAPNVLYVAKDGNDSNNGTSIDNAKLTIAGAVGIATTGTIIKVLAGNYLENNPIEVPAFVSIVGDDLKTVTVSPNTAADDIFHVRKGCYLANMTFTNHVAPAAAIGFPTTEIATNVGGGKWESPYIQNCTSNTTTGTGLRVDGAQAESLKSIVCDSYTQYNQGGVGVAITNQGFAQLVSVFTICCDEAITCYKGSTCDLTNSNSSFGTYGLVSDGVSDEQFTGIVTTSAAAAQDTVVVSISTSIRPYDGQVVYFGELFESVETITVGSGGTGYTSTPTVTIDAPAGPNGETATAFATLDGDSVSEITIISSGSQYRTTPTVTISSPNIGSNTATATAVMAPIYYTINSSTPVTAGISTLTLQENLINSVGVGTTVHFFQQSKIVASSHTFEYVGSGNDITTATPLRGGVQIQENEVVTTNGGKVVYTSTDQSGNFKIGDDLQINQNTGTISGRAFSRSLFTEITPFILALT